MVSKNVRSIVPKSESDLRIKQNITISSNSLRNYARKAPKRKYIKIQILQYLNKGTAGSSYRRNLVKNIVTQKVFYCDLIKPAKWQPNRLHIKCMNDLTVTNSLITLAKQTE